MKAMTKKELLLATLKCEATGRVPISPLSINRFEWANDFPSYKKIIEAVDRVGAPIVKVPLDTAPFLCDPGETRVKTEKRMEGENEIIHQSLMTPKGPLTSVSQRNPKVAGSSAAVKFMVENEEDVEKLLSLEQYGTHLPDVSPILARQREVGENGLCSVNGLRSPFLNPAHAFRYEYFLEFAFTHKDTIHELVSQYEKRLEILIRHLLDKGAGPVFRWYNIEGYTTPMMPPSFADEFIVPSDTRLIKLIHDAGCLVDNHCHGRLRDQAQNFLKMGVDCINCVEPPPANDIDLRELKEKTGGKICFWGYIQWEDMERKSEVEIRRLTRDALDQSGGRGFILSQAASAYASEISPTFERNLLAMIDEGAKFNAHTAS